MKLNLLYLLLFLYTFSSFSQDERFFRKIFSGELISPKSDEPIIKVSVESPEYKIDLNRDSFPESFKTLKKDGSDYIQFFDYRGNLLANIALDPMGINSKLYKVQLKTLSKNTDVLILYYYEGYNLAVQFEAAARLYFLTIENRDLSNIYFYKGPHFFHEKEKIKHQYLRRNYLVNVIDYNGDGFSEISISFNKISRIYSYQNEGKWIIY